MSHTKNQREHDVLVRRALAHHEARKYSSALSLFMQALRKVPGCPVAQYNIANTSHMLGRHKSARAILMKLVSADHKTLGDSCRGVSARSLQMDAYHLLSLVELHCSGSLSKALVFAKQHLRQRRRGLRSIWALKQVRNDIERMTSQRRLAPRSGGRTGDRVPSPYIGARAAQLNR